MLYLNKVTQQFGYTITDIRRAFPHSSIPNDIDEIGDFQSYQMTPIPSIEWNENCYEVVPVERVQQWHVELANQAEIEARILSKIEQVRDERRPKLSETDWTQIPDNQLTPEQKQQWADYRQQLRDITTQSGFPWTVIWPQPPEIE